MIIEVAEEHFSNHLNTEPVMEGERRTTSRDQNGITAPNTKVGGNTSFSISETKSKTKIDYRISHSLSSEKSTTVSVIAEGCGREIV